ncbi:MAG TPA: tetraacyldisaccharide 4'-kinase [Deltaproteobacteria bacterium]|nr:tetraacyldisaccharide 4'-kinase [Deltaproteobacteria bacterium]
MHPWDHPLISALLHPAALLYGGVVRVRETLYERGVFQRKKLPCKVFSVGSITVGGSGKTPMVALLADTLRGRGHRVAILSRGYKGSCERTGALISDGERILLPPEASGDEPQMLARRLKGIPLAVGADRFRMGLELWERFKPELIILDDGFQHLRLLRDLDIVVLDADTDLSRARLLPAGPLREPLSSLRRADLVVITYWDSANSGLEETIHGINPEVPVFHAIAKYKGFIGLEDGELRPPAEFRGVKASVLCAVAKPQRFIQVLEEMGLDVVHKVIRPDHHLWTEEEFVRASVRAEVVIATEKDAVKLPSTPPIPCYVLRMDLQVVEEGFWRMIYKELPGGTG